MLYPDKLVQIQAGLALYIPDPELVRPTYEHLLAKDVTTPFPFWAKIWPSALAISSFLKAEPHWIEGKRVLELGAGMGVPSFAAAVHASEIIISDHATEAVALIRKNIQYLGLQHVQAMCLDWNHFPDNIKAEVLLLSDINYAPDQFASLLVLLHTFLQQGTTIILSTPERITAHAFVTALQPYIKRSFLQPVEEINQIVQIRIIILAI